MTPSRWRRIREWAGVRLLDSRRFATALYAPRRAPDAWTSLCNRIERMTPNPDGRGYRCEWMWGSDLHAALVWPRMARRLMRVALAEWPIRFAARPVSRSGPRISFLFAHGGRDRLPQLLWTLRSVFAQSGIEVECIVVDQSDDPVGGDLPREVVYEHLRTGHLEPGWRKSWAFNVAARRATGDIFVFHDGDVCVPAGYGTELARTMLEGGHDAASMQRFLFYLDQPTTAAIDAREDIPAGATPVRTYQNWKGGTIALRPEAFFDLGGFDEGFVDWGGEDDEFYDRCGLLNHYRFGYLPFVHLWHAPQGDRHSRGNLNIEQVLPQRLQTARESRRNELIERQFGQTAGPDPVESYKSLAAEVDACA